VNEKTPEKKTTKRKLFKKSEEKIKTGKKSTKENTKNEESIKDKILKALGFETERAPRGNDNMEKKYHDPADPDNVRNI